MSSMTLILMASALAAGPLEAKTVGDIPTVRALLAGKTGGTFAPPREGSYEPDPAKGQEQAFGIEMADLAHIEIIATFISQNYIDPVESKKLYYGALRGMAQTLDPYSEFVAPDEAAKFNEQIPGAFGGIGAGISRKTEGRPAAIRYVIPGSPAEEAGLKSGDEILEVNGEPTAPMSLDDAIAKIKGPDGTSVTLRIGREGPAAKEPASFTVTIDRAVVQAPNVLSKLLPGGAGYVYFASFKENTADEVLARVRALRDRGASSLILDIRNNPGGYLLTATKLASAFLSQGQLVLSVKDREGRTEKYIKPKDGEFKDMPLKVLVNGHSASASEIFAGAIQDLKRGTIVGRRTYGKGVAQSVIPLPDGSILKLTVNRWYTPLGRSIQRDAAGAGGITPDVVVDVSEEEEAPALRRILQEMNGAPLDPPAADAALERALQSRCRREP